MSWYQAMKDAARVFGEVKDAETREALANLKMEGAELAEENARLREEVQQLREQAKVSESLEFVDPVYWRKLEKSRDGPFCSRCWDADQKLIRLHDRSSSTFWHCPACDENPRQQ